MRKRSVTVTLHIAVLLACLFTITTDVVGAQQVNFSLVPSQSIALGGYTLQFTGLTGKFPSYNLYSGGVLKAHFPSEPMPLNGSKYVYANVVILTTSVSPGGTNATGVLSIY